MSEEVIGLPQLAVTQHAVPKAFNMLNSSRGVHKKTKMCCFAENGFCARGASCSYAHSSDELRNSDAPDRFTKTKRCTNHFKNGYCLNGASCSFAHSVHELSAAPDLSKTKLCRNFDQGKCNYANCAFAHGPEEIRIEIDATRTTLGLHSKIDAKTALNTYIMRYHKQKYGQRTSYQRVTTSEVRSYFTYTGDYDNTHMILDDTSANYFKYQCTLKLYRMHDDVEHRNDVMEFMSEACADAKDAEQNAAQIALARLAEGITAALPAGKNRDDENAAGTTSVARAWRDGLEIMPAASEPGAASSASPAPPPTLSLPAASKSEAASSPTTPPPLSADEEACDGDDQGRDRVDGYPPLGLHSFLPAFRPPPGLPEPEPVACSSSSVSSSSGRQEASSISTTPSRGDRDEEASRTSGSEIIEYTKEPARNSNNKIVYKRKCLDEDISEASQVRAALRAWSSTNSQKSCQEADAQAQTQYYSIADDMPDFPEDEEKMYIMKFSWDPQALQAALHKELQQRFTNAEIECYTGKFRETTLVVHPTQYMNVKSQVQKRLDADLLKPNHVVVSETYKGAVMSALSDHRTCGKRGRAVLVEIGTFFVPQAPSF